MNLTENEILTLIDRLRALNVVAWELVALVPTKGNTALLNETDSMVERFDEAAAD